MSVLKVYLLFETVKCHNKSRFRPPQVYANLLRVGNVNCRHLKATFVEAWTATQFLNYLHHHPLQRQTHESSHSAWTSRTETGQFWRDLLVCRSHCLLHPPCWGRTSVCLHISRSASPLCWGCVCTGPDPSGQRTQISDRSVLLHRKKRNHSRSAPASEGRYNSKDIPNHVMALLTSKG